MSRKSLAGSLIALSLAACGSPEPGSPEAVLAAQEAENRVRIAAVEDAVDDVPEWYLNLPKDDISLYAAGVAASPDLQLAVDKSEISAKRSLADRINGHLSSKLKTYVGEVGPHDRRAALRQAEQVTTNLVTEISMKGYQRSRIEVRPEGRNFRVYVLLRYPLGEANRILVDEMKRNRQLTARLRATKAFEELEREIDRAREAARSAR